MELSVVHSFRRGTGKTTIAANVATIMAQAGLRVGLIDVNFPSPSLHILFGIAPDEIGDTVNDYLWGNCSIADATYDLTRRLRMSGEMPGRLFLVPASTDYSAITRMVRGGYYVDLLGNAFQELDEQFDLDCLLVDTPAGLDEETLFAISRADRLFIILRPDRQDYLGTHVIAEIAARLDLPQAALIVNEIPPQMDAEQVRATLEGTFPFAVVSALKHTDSLLALASSGIFILHHPRHPLTRKLKALAHHFGMEADEKQ